MKKILLTLLLLSNLLLAGEVGIASHYSVRTNGTRTASGIPLSDHKLTAAHKTLKFGTVVEVTNLRNGKKVDVVITNRGPYIKGRIIDLSQAAAKQLGFQKQGLTKVRVRVKSAPKNKN
jgi:rare lipoprotein A